MDYYRGLGVKDFAFSFHEQRPGILTEAEALARRVAIYRRERVPWVDESERVLAYVAEHGRIVPEHFAAMVGWQPKVEAIDQLSVTSRAG